MVMALIVAFCVLLVVAVTVFVVCWRRERRRNRLYVKPPLLLFVFSIYRPDVGLVYVSCSASTCRFALLTVCEISSIFSDGNHA